MAVSLKSNKYFLVALVLCIILGGLTFTNLPGPNTTTSIQTINGTTFDFADYPSLTHEQLAIFNYLHTLLDQPLGEWEGWHITSDLYSLVHYQLAFMTYSIARLFEVTNGYRTNHYSSLAKNLIYKMNTSYEEYGESSIEAMEWLRPSIGYANWTQYHYPDYHNESHVYTGGFRRPANIMWTAHYALMELLYKRSFNSDEFFNEFTWYMEDWNTSLTTDGFGNDARDTGGIWNCGLIPCQPYEVWTQCNSIPILFTELYDNMYGTDYMPIWDYGIQFMEDEMTDDYGLTIDGYFVQEPVGYTHTQFEVQQQFPGPQLDRYISDGRPYVSAYGVAWTLTFLQYSRPDLTLPDYDVFLQHYMKEISGDQAYIIDSFNNPAGFGTYDILANLFALELAEQRGDLVTRDRILNFLYSLYNKEWSADNRAMHWNTMAIEPFLESSLAYGWIWATVPVSVIDLAEPRPAAFWNYPYISAADDDKIWIYQAQWDPTKNGFILNIRVDQTATLTFSNFDQAPTAYSGGAELVQLTASGNEYILSLEPGSYHLVVM
jgi:hypothetical protein